MKKITQFADRKEAGKLLAKKLKEYRNKPVVVYAIPRGGVIVAHEIATYLHAPLNFILVKKLTHPFSPEYAIGAVSERGEKIVNEEIVWNLDDKWLLMEEHKLIQELTRKKQLYNKFHHNVNTKNKIVILVDDGIATGYTIQAALKELKRFHPKEIIVAIPVLPYRLFKQFQPTSINIITLLKPEHFLGSVSAYYNQFPQVTDEEICTVLRNLQKYTSLH